MMLVKQQTTSLAGIIIIIKMMMMAAGLSSSTIRHVQAFVPKSQYHRTIPFSSRLPLGVAGGHFRQQKSDTATPILRQSSSGSSSKSEAESFLDNLGDLLDEQQKRQPQSESSRKEDAGTKDSEGWRIINWKSRFAKRLQQLTSVSHKDAGTGVSPPIRQDPSPVDRILIRNRLVYFKRDDQLKLSTRGGGSGAPISGNKARKMIALNELGGPPSQEEEDRESDLDLEFPSCVVSFGGPQSNAMLALAAIVHFQNQKALAASSGETPDDIDSIDALDELDDSDDNDNRNNDEQDPTPPTQHQPPLKRFVYYTKKLPRFLRNQPNGNLFRAQTLGMEMVELSTEEYANLFGGEWGGPTEAPCIEAPIPGDSLWVPQGGACGMALQGAWELANEIVSFWSEHGKRRPLTVCIPGGTCSTAVLVNNAMRGILKEEGKDNSSMDIQVVVIPCVGDEKYAQRQMTSLTINTGSGEETSKLKDRIPAILPPAPASPRYFGQTSSADDTSYFRFGEPNETILSTFREMKDNYGITLDLLYGAPSWTVLLRHFRTEPTSAAFDAKAPLAGREIMYVHSGGLEGISSQLMRYKYKGLIDIEEVQLPGRQ